MMARPIMKSALQWGINSPNTSVIQPSASEHWSRTKRMTIGKTAALGAPHTGERSEKELIASFVARIAELTPQLVTFNGASFDLPVLRYRAMVNGVAAPGL